MNRDVDTIYNFIRGQIMGTNEFFGTMGGKDYMITFSFLLVGASVIVWCLTSALTGPLEHIACPLLSMF